MLELFYFHIFGGMIARRTKCFWKFYIFRKIITDLLSNTTDQITQITQFHDLAHRLNGLEEVYRGEE